MTLPKVFPSNDSFVLAVTEASSFQYMHIYICVCVYNVSYIFFVVKVDFNWRHEMRSTSNFWCQRFTMIALKCDIILSESQI